MPIRVGLLVSEFFDSSLKKRHAMLGGYGMLARNYICEFVPNSEITIETILGINDQPRFDSTVVDGRKKLILLPDWQAGFKPRRLYRLQRVVRKALWRRRLRRFLSSFDVFVTIETMNYELIEYVRKTKLILYIQDPRPQSEWDELDTVTRTDDGSPRPNPLVRNFYRKMIRQDRLVVMSQGEDLVRKARELYELPDEFPVQLVRNPVLIRGDVDLSRQAKGDSVVFLGRLDPVKRPWLALEVAKRMPHVQFYFLGQAHDETIPYIVYPYRDLPNVELMGHQSNSTKDELLRRAKILINSSIHEAIPVSFLEALAHGTLIVSCQNPDGITQRFGVFTGKILGDGRDQAHLFVTAIQSILDDEPRRRRLAEQAVAYAKKEHNLGLWVDMMRDVIRKSVLS